MSLEFGTPEHGWLEVRISGPGGEVTHDVSDVPADSLGMLADVLCNLISGSEDSTVTWFLEPSIWRWTIRRDGDAMIVLHQVDDEPAVAIAREDARRVLHTFWRALRELETRPDWVADRDEQVRWSHPGVYREIGHMT